MKFGIIGCGYFGKNYVRILREMKDVQLVGVANRTSAVFEKYKDLLTGVKTTINPSDIINDASVDCVIIATPPSTHCALAIEALSAGKHVLLEKPMCVNLAEAKLLKKAVSKSRKIFMTGHQYVYNDYVNFILDNIASLGKIKHVYAEHFYYGMQRNDVGCFLDAGTHMLSMIKYLFNASKITKVNGKSVYLEQDGRDDSTSCVVEFDKPFTANLQMSWISPVKSCKFMIVGSTGTMVFDEMAEYKLKMFEISYPAVKSSGSTTFLSLPEPKIANVISREPLKNQVFHFIDCINSGKEPLTGIKHSYLVSEWIEKIAKKIR